MNAVKKNKVVYVLDEKAGTYQAWDYETLVMKYQDGGKVPLYKIRKVDNEYAVFKRCFVDEYAAFTRNWEEGYVELMAICTAEEDAKDIIFNLAERNFDDMVNDGHIVFTHTEAEAKARLDWLGYK